MVVLAPCVDRLCSLRSMGIALHFRFKGSIAQLFTPLLVT